MTSARKRIKRLDPNLPPLEDPYEVGTDQKLLRPEDEPYCYTAAAFDHFCNGRKLTFTDAGPILFRLWSKFMIRRDFESNDIIDPRGTTHRIGASMPKAHRYTMRLKMTMGMQHLHDYAIKPFLSNSLMPDPNNINTMILNGKSTRILGLGAISPLLFLAKGVHSAKVRVEKPSLEDGDVEYLASTDDESESDSDSSADDSDRSELGLSDFEQHASDEDAPVKRRKRRVRMVESPDAKEYRRLFETKDTAGFCASSSLISMRVQRIWILRSISRFSVIKTLRKWDRKPWQPC
ncbi:hypothetical protein N0V86_009639 [Didymella sp. IMI 355093]|nr:hypothetical protein N0V86_009639 [Didymella sp. IMI 355093]